MPFSPLVPGKARFINCNERNLIIFLQIHGTVGKCVFIAPQYWCQNWGTLLAWVHWTAHMHNTSLQMRCVVVCLPRSLRRFYLRIWSRSRSRRALQWTGDRSCDAQFHFSRTLPPPAQPSPAPSPAQPALPMCIQTVPSSTNNSEQRDPRAWSVVLAVTSQESCKVNANHSIFSAVVDIHMTMQKDS